jgi:hypothetical protein
MFISELNTLETVEAVNVIGGWSKPNAHRNNFTKPKRNKGGVRNSIKVKVEQNAFAENKAGNFYYTKNNEFNATAFNDSTVLVQL